MELVEREGTDACHRSGILGGMDGMRTGTFVAFSLRYHRLIDYLTFVSF